MGATYVAETATGPDPGEALNAMLDKLTGSYEGWTDPRDKPGHVQTWETPVTDDAIEWMRGWTQRNPPEGVDPSDKWGPWLMFPLASGGWHFYGLVNT